MIKRNNWAANPLKLQRAITKAGPDASEEAIKEAYISLGGKVLHSETKSTEVEEVIETNEPIIEAPTEIVEQPKAKSRAKRLDS